MRQLAAAQALLVVDVQRGWVSEPLAVEGAADLVARLAAGRELALPVAR